jgi:hypothetical protein
VAKASLHHQPLKEAAPFLANTTVSCSSTIKDIHPNRHHGCGKEDKKVCDRESPILMLFLIAISFMALTVRQVKRVISKRDERLKANKDKADIGNEKKQKEAFPEEVRVM